MNDIFISYSSKDRDWVKTLALALEAEGYDVWWDPEILPGQDYEKVIKDALNQTHCVLTVWSENSIQSHWVKGETSQGLARNIYVPVLYQQVEVPIQFGHLQSSSLIDWQGKTNDPRYQKLLRAIALNVKPSQKPKPKSESSIKQENNIPRPKQRYALWLIIITVLLGGGYFAYSYYKKQLSSSYNLILEKTVGRGSGTIGMANATKKSLIVSPGDVITYKLTYKNELSSKAIPLGTKIYDDYDETKLEIMWLPDNPKKCIHDGSNIICDAYDLAPLKGSNIHIFYYVARVKSGATGTIVNKAEIKPANDQDTKQSDDISVAILESTQQDINGQCGPGATTYTSIVKAYPLEVSFCSKGVLSPPAAPVFPKIGHSVEWTCKGINNGKDKQCIADRVSVETEKQIAKIKKQFGQYIDNEDGTITDTKTKLMWKKCSEGLSGEQCKQGKAKKYTWDKATILAKNTQYAGYSNWRLPRIEELHSLVYCSNGIPQSKAWDYTCSGENNRGKNFQRPAINQIAFPATQLHKYWSSSSIDNGSNFVWSINFDGGNDSTPYKFSNNHVRLVHSGQ